MNRKVVAVILVVAVALGLTRSVCAVDWNKVAEFTCYGSGEHYMGDFACEHVEWRTQWKFWTDETGGSITISLYAHNQTDLWIFDVINDTGIGLSGSPVKGCEYYNWNKGWFSVWLDSGYGVVACTVIIEQDMDSAIPEFGVLGLMIFFVFSTLGLVLYRRKKCDRKE